MKFALSQPLKRNPDQQAGFTLLELMVVLLILAMLASIAAPQVMKQLGKAKGQTAAIQVESLSAALDYYKIDLGHYPNQEGGLQALLSKPGNETNWDGPYLKKKGSLIDPWGKAYFYKFPGEHGAYDLYSFGADGKEGGTGEDRDLVSW